MQAYIIRRLLLTIPTLIGISFIVFVSVRFIPGTIVDQLLANTDATPEIRKQLEEEYNLTGNIVVKYVEWMGNLAKFDLGTSAISRRPITEALGERLPATMELGFLGLLLSQLIGIPIGTIAAIRQDTPLDYITRSFAIALLAVPSFWLALLAITYGFNWFGWTPPLRYEKLWVDPISNIKSIWIPALILGAGSSGSLMRLTRTTMLDAMRQDYVRTAWSKGLRERVIIFRHVLRNAMIPVVTVIGLQIPALVGGTVILERIFTIPGMGTFLLDSVNQRDYPAVQALVLLSAVVIVFATLLVDLTYPLIDPRIKYS